jgi:putative transposase
MKRSKFTDQQIVFALKQAETDVSVAEVCRKLGISEATFYNWKKKYDGLGTAELRRLRQLEDENIKRRIQLAKKRSPKRKRTVPNDSTCLTISRAMRHPKALRMLDGETLVDAKTFIDRWCRMSG